MKSSFVFYVLFIVLVIVLTTTATTIKTTTTTTTTTTTNTPIKCNTYVDSNSNYTNHCGTLNFPCSNIQQSIESCNSTFDEITIIIKPGVYSLNSTIFNEITNKVINILNSDLIGSSDSGDNNNSSSNNNSSNSYSYSNNSDTNSINSSGNNNNNQTNSGSGGSGSSNEIINNNVIINTSNFNSLINILPKQSNDFTNIYILGITFVNNASTTTPSNSICTIITNQGSLINITIDQSTFIGHINQNNNGGGILSILSGIGNKDQQNSTVTITNSQFLNSTSTMGGQIPTSTGGALLFSNSTTQFTLNNCTFLNNLGTGSTVINSGGSIIYIGSGYLTVTNSLIQGTNGISNAFFLSSSSASENGSPLFYFGNTNFTESYNSVGFLIFGVNSSTTFYQCTFSNNVNTVSVESVYTNSPVLVDQCTFINNNNSRMPVGTTQAGAILVSDSVLTVQSSVFIDNRAPYGGAIQINGTLELQKVSIYNSIFNGNNASIAGGSVYAQGGTVFMYNSNFENNLAASGSSIYCLNSEINFTNMTFTNNTDSSIPTPNGIGCGSGKVCSILGDSDLQNSCSYDYQPKKPSLLTPGEVAAIVICVIIGAAGIATVLILIVRRISRRNPYRPINDY